MKILFYFAILAAVMMIPNQGTDVGKLLPVEVIAVSESGGKITVRTDTGDWGEGETFESAFQDLKHTAPGIIYLDTAEYLLLEPGVKDSEQLADYLKGSIQVYRAKEEIPMEGIANYLLIHSSGICMKEIANEGRIPTITEENGRYQITEK